jgi:hypothetical protein
MEAHSRKKRAKAGRVKNVVDQLRRAIEDSGESQYALWKATGVDQGVLSRLCEHLGLELKRR